MPNRRGPTISSLSWFIARCQCVSSHFRACSLTIARLPSVHIYVKMYKASSFVQVTRLGIEIAADGDASRVEVEEHFTQLASILDVCSSTLRSLRLRLLQATKFKDYETSLLGPSKLERILVSLYIGKALLHNHLGAALHLWIALELSAARGV